MCVGEGLVRAACLGPVPALQDPLYCATTSQPPLYPAPYPPPAHPRLRSPLPSPQCFFGFAAVAGKAQRMCLHPGAPLAPAGDAPSLLPLVVFSHGICGSRFM